MPDPEQNIKFISWNDLQNQDPNSVYGLLDELGLHPDIFHNATCKTWTSPDHTIDSHVFYPTDDTYPRHILENCDYPGFRSNGNIIFRCVKLDDSKFCQDLRKALVDLGKSQTTFRDGSSALLTSLLERLCNYTRSRKPYLLSVGDSTWSQSLVIT